VSAALGQELSQRAGAYGRCGRFARKVEPTGAVAHKISRSKSWPAGPLLTGQLRYVTASVVAMAAVAVAAGVGCRREDTRPSPQVQAGALRGGDLVTAIRSDPQSLNWYTRRDASTHLVSVLTQARLVRVNRATHEVEPWIAESWDRSPDGLRYTIRLRKNVVFADGHPFTADDVVFSLRAAYDPASTIADSLQVNGRKLTIEAPDASTVVVTFPSPFGPGLRLLDTLPILPKHKLESVLEQGRFGAAWSLSTPLDQITGLGPFVLSEYAPGQRLVFQRNTHYFRKEGQADLPYLDRVIVEIVPEQDAQVLALQSGRSDMSAFEVRPEDYAPLKRAADQGSLQLLDLGVGMDPNAFWINLKPGAFAHDPRAAWIQRDELRQAISLAVDRQAFADAVYLGAAVPVDGPVTPANKRWYSDEVPRTPHDPARAKALLASIGLQDRNGDGRAEDAAGRPATLTLISQKGQTALERGAMVIRDQVKAIGLTIDVVLLDGGAVVTRFLSGKDYDAVYFPLVVSDTDPVLNPDFWLSGGSSRVWNLGQKTPATDWEREIDGLMARQSAALDEAERRRLFIEVQKIFAAHAPMLYFAAPRIYVAASSRVTHLTPAVSRPQLLWAADTIAVKH
jgi:peptide/nickel transport system substrate-binding protein